METIFFERQEGMLCAQHALNMLLQQAFFTAVDLAEIARELDDREKAVMSPSTLANFQSSNYDDSGYFSIQVITEALKTFDLRIIQLDNPNYIAYRTNPENATAYICNLQLHWFTIRKFGNQWFHLNSLRNSPELISESSLKKFFNDIIQQGYSVFLIEGLLPESLANNVISQQPIPYSGILGAPTVINEEDEELAIALSLSEAEHIKTITSKKNDTNMEIDDAQLQKALQESLKGVNFSKKENEKKKTIMQEYKDREALNSTDIASTSQEVPKNTLSYPIEERIQLRKDISLNQAETIRQQRSRFLDKLESHSNASLKPEE